MSRTLPSTDTDRDRAASAHITTADAGAADGPVSPSPRSVLVIKPRALGDVLLSTIILPNLRAAWPSAHITFLCEPAAQDLVVSHPCVDSVLLFRKSESYPRFLWNLFRTRYDVVIDLFCNPRTAQMTWATRAPFRVGFPMRGRRYAYTHLTTGDPDTMHNAVYNLEALKPLGIPVVTREVRYDPPEASLSWAREYMARLRMSHPRIIAMNPNVSMDIRRWPIPSFAQLADRIHEATGALPLLIYGPGEEPIVEAMRSAMNGPSHVPPLLSIPDLAALLSNCDALVTNNSGPLHIAAAVGTPALVINGSTKAHLQGPYAHNGAVVQADHLDCLGCNLKSCPIGNLCMTELSVDTVFDATLALYHTWVEPSV